MRIKKIYCDDIKKAQIDAPWGVKFERIGGGFIVFESMQDFYLWSRENAHKNTNKIR